MVTEYILNKDYSFEGLWYLPENSIKYGCCGTLSYSKDYGYRLNTIFRIEDSEDDNPFTKVEVPVIYGFTKDGKKITLFNSMSYTPRISFPGLEMREYAPKYIVINEHINNNNSSYEYAIVNINHLQEWFRYKGFKITIQRDEYVNIKYNKQDAKIIKSDKGSIHLKESILYSMQTETCGLDLKCYVIAQIYNTHKKLYEYIYTINILSNFITFMTRALSYPISIRLYRDERTYVWLLYNNSFTYSYDLIQPMNMLQLYNDLEYDINNIYNNWIKIYSQNNKALELFTNTLYIYELHLQYRFLNIIFVLESISRNIIGINNNTILKDIIKKAIYYTGIYNETSDIVIDIFSKRIVYARAYYIHSKSKLKQHSLSPKQLLLCIKKIRTIIECILFKKLGISSDKVKIAFTEPSLLSDFSLEIEDELE